MKKIPTIFERDADDPSRVSHVVNPECQWVLDGEGYATEKIDGTACLIKRGRFYKRSTIKKGGDRPAGFVFAGSTEEKQQGWVPVNGCPDCVWHTEAWGNMINSLGIKAVLSGGLDGTYELVGPKVRRNPYDLQAHRLWRHGCIVIPEAEGPRSFDSLRVLVNTSNRWGQYYEGVVFYNPVTRQMAKIKRRDFGLAWPAPRE
jgi:hypothetical protein